MEGGAMGSVHNKLSQLQRDVAASFFRSRSRSFSRAVARWSGSTLAIEQQRISICSGRTQKPSLVGGKPISVLPRLMT